MKTESQRVIEKAVTNRNPQNPNDDTNQDVRQGRRVSDAIVPKDATHKMNLERRVKGNERRQSDNSSYRGPGRRLTVDRRINTKDRRNESSQS